MENPKSNGENRLQDPKTGRFVEGNPGGGRPKGAGISITTEIKRKLNDIPKGEKKTYLAFLVEQIMKKAVIDGNEQLIGKIWSYIDGMPEVNLNVNKWQDLADKVYDFTPEPNENKAIDRVEPEQLAKGSIPESGKVQDNNGGEKIG